MWHVLTILSHAIIVINLDIWQGIAPTHTEFGRRHMTFFPARGGRKGWNWPAKFQWQKFYCIRIACEWNLSCFMFKPFSCKMLRLFMMGARDEKTWYSSHLLLSALGKSECVCDPASLRLSVCVTPPRSGWVHVWRWHRRRQSFKKKKSNK